MKHLIITRDFNMEDNIQDQTPGPGGCGGILLGFIGLVVLAAGFTAAWVIVEFILWMWF